MGCDGGKQKSSLLPSKQDPHFALPLVASGRAGPQTLYRPLQTQPKAEEEKEQTFASGGGIRPMRPREKEQLFGRGVPFVCRGDDGEFPAAAGRVEGFFCSG